jgi:hypothetical protein
VFDLVSYAYRTRPSAFETGFYVHVLTDSSYVARMLAEIDPVKTLKAKAHPHIWAGLAQARRRGICLVPHLLPRNSNPMMIAADHLSKMARKAIVKAHSSAVGTSAVAVVKEAFPLQRVKNGN